MKKNEEILEAGKKKTERVKVERVKPEGEKIEKIKSGKIKVEETDEQYENCICCHRKLNIPTDMEIDYRPFYIEGAGQLCYDCYRKLYG